MIADGFSASRLRHPRASVYRHTTVHSATRGRISFTCPMCSKEFGNTFTCRLPLQESVLRKGIALTEDRGENCENY